MPYFDTIPGEVVHNCYSLRAYNQLSEWNRSSGTIGPQFMRTIASEFGYAGLVIAGLVECIAKSFFSLIVIQFNYGYGYQMSNDAAFSYQVALCSTAQLIKNLFKSDRSLLPLSAILANPR